MLASRGRFGTAAFFIVLGGVADSLDGRIARATGTGSRFGEELDSLVDAISFGLAPALIMYFAVLKTDGNDWIYVFIFASCAVIRLARFNVEQAGRAKTHFHGLAESRGGDDARDVLLVQPDVAVQRHRHLLHRQSHARRAAVAHDSALAHGAASRTS